MFPLSTYFGGPSMAETGLVAAVVSFAVYLPVESLSRTAMVGCAVAVSALGYSGAHAQIRYW